MRIENDLKLDFDDVLIRPKRSALNSRKEVSLERTFRFKHSQSTWSGVPVMASNMDTTGTFAMARALREYNMMVALHKHYSSQQLVEQLSEWQNELHDYANYINSNVFISIGTSKDEIPRIREAAKLSRNIMIDVANGYSEHFVDCIKRVRDEFPEHVIAAGNVVTADMTEAIILAGADIVKCGVGNGSACSTRIQTGIGYPQLSAVMECADAAHGLDGHIICDGGCNTPADFAKAFGAGADFVMSGSFFAGHAEGGGEMINSDDELYVKYYGMSSNTAQEKYNDGLRDYRSSEGRTVLIPYKGKVSETCKNLLGGLRSACTYVGAHTIKQLPKRTTFVRVSNTHNKIFADKTIRL